MTDALTIAIAQAGGLCALARELTSASGALVRPQTIAGWRRRGQVPADQVWTFARATRIPPWLIRADLYDEPQVYKAKVDLALGGKSA